MNGSKGWWPVIVILTLLSLLISLVGPFSALKNSREMGTSIQSALTGAGFDKVKVAMDGSLATLTGGVKTEARKAKAMALANATKCEKCRGKKARSWHSVKDGGLSVSMANASPYIFTASKAANGRVIVDGFVRSEEEKTDVLAHAHALFGDNVTNQTLKLASGAPNKAWGEVVKTQLTNLSALETGRATMGDFKIGLTGIAASEAAREALLASASAPDAYQFTSKIGFPDPVAVDVIPEAIKVEQDNCQAKIDTAKGAQKVLFRYGRAEVSTESFAMLNALAAVALECPAYGLRVEGHTDADGSAAYNQTLSIQRAQIVASYLAARGVDKTSLEPIGLGEDNPIASNATAAGKQQNRRIEFIVTYNQ
jgi:outer membrane protein OmpA-like peptidoglycan-associated protein